MTSAGAALGDVGLVGKSAVKPPNILILCDDVKKRSEIGEVIKGLVAKDRYAIYDIQWDQLGSSGWFEGTALLILAGKVPDKAGVSLIYKFLEDGGRLLSWCCESYPFGPKNASATSTQKRVIQYGPGQKVTHPLVISDNLWGAGYGQPPPELQYAFQTNELESNFKPTSVSAFGRVKETNQSCIVELDGGTLGGKGKAVLSQVHFEKCVEEMDAMPLLSLLLKQSLGVDCTQVRAPEYTVGYLLGDEKTVEDFLKSYSSTPTIPQSSLTLEFVPPGEPCPVPNHLLLPIKSWECPEKFSVTEFSKNLTTKTLGRLAIYTDVIASTMNVFNGQLLGHGVVAIAGQQTAGRGRGKNVWLSPLGCALFSVQLSFDKDSVMGGKISFLQNLAGLAAVLAVQNHKELGLRVKWPNDIYAGPTKIGGVLVESTLVERKLNVNVGIGINVSNTYPTTSLNSVIQYSSAEGASSASAPLTVEKLIARVLSEFEILLEDVENNSSEKVTQAYVDNWLHGSISEDSEENHVRVEISGGKFVDCRIIGINEFGYLRVREISSGNEFCVRPDGNSFDIMNKLIAIKE